MRWSSPNHVLLLRYAGLFTYLCVGIPLLRGDWVFSRLSDLSRPSIALLLWAACYLIFGVTYWLLTRNLGSRRHWGIKLLGLLVLSLAAMAVGWLSQSGLSALLLVVVAVVLPWLLPLPIGLAWMVLQNFALVPVFVNQPASVGQPKWTVGLAALQASVYLGISVLTFVASLVARQQAEAREQQREMNSELRATRALLAESSRIAERMRIARELHDLVGHHLTALSLNLEVASHVCEGQAESHVRKAQDMARQLLSDVREVVSELRQDDALDLTQALRGLIEGVPGLRVHLDLPPRFAVEEPQRAQIVLRCAQEIVTNTVRHSGARNLWLRFEHTADSGLKLSARDDGRGAETFTPGNGLNGMRERLAGLGGRLSVNTARERGFTLDAWLPMETH